MPHSTCSDVSIPNYLFHLHPSLSKIRPPSFQPITVEPITPQACMCTFHRVFHMSPQHSRNSWTCFDALSYDKPRFHVFCDLSHMLKLPLLLLPFPSHFFYVFFLILFQNQFIHALFIALLLFSIKFVQWKTCNVSSSNGTWFFLTLFMTFSYSISFLLIFSPCYSLIPYFRDRFFWCRCRAL